MLQSVKKWRRRSWSDDLLNAERIKGGIGNENSSTNSRPLGDPVEIAVRGYELSIRKADAEMIEVE